VACTWGAWLTDLGPNQTHPWCPRLEELEIFASKIEHARRPRRHLPAAPQVHVPGRQDEVDVNPSGMSPPSFAEIVTDAPVLVELDVYYS
jgi:hypothetical protein